MFHKWSGKLTVTYPLWVPQSRGLSESPTGGRDQNISLLSHVIWGQRTLFLDRQGPLRSKKNTNPLSVLRKSLQKKSLVLSIMLEM